MSIIKNIKQSIRLTIHAIKKAWQESIEIYKEDLNLWKLKL